MPRTITPEQHAQLEALNSKVQFDTFITSKRDENGELILDAKERSKDKSVARAMLSSKADGKVWLTGYGGDNETACDAALKAARTSERPASTARDLMEKNRLLEEEIARLRAGQSSVSPGVSAVLTEGSPASLPLPTNPSLTDAAPTIAKSPIAIPRSENRGSPTPERIQKAKARAAKETVKS